MMDRKLIASIILSFLLVSFLFIALPNQSNAGIFFAGNSCCISGDGCVEFEPGSPVACIQGTFEEDGACTSDGQCVPRPQDVPALEEWGLIAMAGILGIIAFIMIRRRKTTA